MSSSPPVVLQHRDPAFVRRTLPVWGYDYTDLDEVVRFERRVAELLPAAATVS